ncbi:transcription antitermination factor NusB [Candidatus Dependentiae bacterium HGW-Dependentiae-1]|nr:MAG: transcription antitermination factor NusB [Candidatus Dependentiae bacterium HGW-Dependentiae-1]
MTRCSLPDEVESNPTGAGDESAGKARKAVTKKTAAIGKKLTDINAQIVDTSVVEPSAETAVDQEQDLDPVLTGKRQERALIFHLLYAVEGFEYQESLEAIVDNFNRGFEQSISVDSDAFRIAYAVIQERDTLDKAIEPFLANWRFERLSVCTKLILRLAFWELLNTENPPAIVLNEAIELTKCFAESDAYRFVNGVLDSFVKRREAEQGVGSASDGITSQD